MVAITGETPEPSVAGEQVMIDYQVAAKVPGVGTPSANVTVTDGVDSCNGTVAAGNCILTLSTAGLRTLRATYSGETNFTGGSSADKSHLVRIPIRVDQVYPAAADAGERVSMTITGDGFTPESKVSIEGLGLRIFTRYVSESRLTAIVIVSPTALSSVRDVTVTNPDGGSDTRRGAFVVR